MANKLNKYQRGPDFVLGFSGVMTKVLYTNLDILVNNEFHCKDDWNIFLRDDGENSEWAQMKEFEECEKTNSIFRTGLLIVPEDMIMPNLLVRLGLFESTSEARRNGFGGKNVDIPWGINEFELGSKSVLGHKDGKPIWAKPHKIYTFKPTSDNVVSYWKMKNKFLHGK